MLWSLLAAFVVGIALGLRFRAPALIAATGLVVVSTVLASAVADAPRSGLPLALLASVLALQAGYLVGVLGAVWRRRGAGRER